MGKEEAILVVDIGTTKICALIGEEREGNLWVTGMGVVPSKGLRKGVVINIEEATTSIKSAIERAKIQAKVNVKNVYTSIAGSHIKTVSGMGVVALKEKQVSSVEVQEVLESAQALELPTDRTILHVIPQEFIVDQHRGILDPKGMTGMRLEAHVQFITANRSVIQNLMRCFEKLNLEVEGIVFQGLASAEAVLTPEEKELGVLLIDFGGGTTDIVAFWENVLRFVSSIPVGGELLTNDLAIGLRTSRAEAERLKIQSGVCLRDLVKEEEILEVAGIGNRPSKNLSRKVLAEILELRVRELLELVEAEISNFGDRTKINSGLVLTGGSALIPGIIYLADQILDLPTRIGYPPKLPGLTEEIYHPQYATAVGLLLYAYNTLKSEEEEESKSKSFWEKIKEFIKAKF